MFHELIAFPIEHPRLQWDAKQVLRDLRGKPHLFIRLRLRGTQFPHRALEPFVRIGRVRSVFVDIDPDELTARAYFDRMPPDEGVIEFGYENEVLLRFGRRFNRADAPLLERRKLPRGTRNLEAFFSPIR